MKRQPHKSPETNLKAILIVVAFIVLSLAIIWAREGTVHKIDGHDYIYLPENAYAPLQHSPTVPAERESSNEREDRSNF